MKKKTLYIENMTCAHCESRIEQELQKQKGITDVTASYVSGSVTVTFDENTIGLEQIIAVLEGIDYLVKREGLEPVEYGNKNADKTGALGRESKGSRDYSNIVGVAIILFTAYIIAWRFNLLHIFYDFPLAAEGMGYGMLFLVGLMTSIHCVAMCGGICLSQSIPTEGAAPSERRLYVLKPSLLYNLGRVLSYTLIGGIVGAIGSAVSFTGTMKGIVQILAGVFMVIMGINMLGIFPGLRRFNPRMPKQFAKKINAQRGGRGPFYIGLLNGLMPCGPLQAMQLYALSTGSPLKGALSMLIFSIGTVPLLFAFGAVSTFFHKKFTERMMTVSAVLVVVLGIFMFNNGISLSGFNLPTLTSQAGTVKTSAVATIEDGVQTVTTGISSGKYESIVVQKGLPVIWTIQAEDGDLNGCNNRIIIQKYGIEKSLSTGDNVIKFTPEESGTVSYSCWMGMIRSKIVVVDDLSNVDSSQIVDDSSQSSGSCCSSSAGTASSSDSSSDTGSSTSSDSSDTAAGGCCGGDTGSGSSISFDYSTLEGKRVKADTLTVAKIEDDLQYVEITYDKNGFSPAVVVVQRGVETKWVINGADSPRADLIFPYYQAQLTMEEGENPISFVPNQDFDFFTADGSYVGYVKVVEDISQIDKDAIQKEITDFDPASKSISND